ncbi:uncharacterized protein SAPINGB_P001087 [Magnusiomyces paraingens]|uniref:Uncharacterized protein n=1 Tax=Magnusiomyces paraingens TaxID=2606893 RepID=A0A5E8B4I2_9ASCO|nr:uncharacterized protein SAPINGB_P001087 [Saprochaete ingens]VVT46183.1 unnamed protein product [Saprochaete ingens]
MSSVVNYVQNLWQSVLTPGLSPTLIGSTHVSFGLLLIVLVFMLVYTGSLHFLALLLIASGLWAAITWFIGEVQLLELEKRKKEEEEEKEKEKEKDQKKDAEKPEAVTSGSQPLSSSSS